MPFVIEKAERVKKFIECLKHTKGQWAGKPFKLIEWEWEEVIKPLFGTLKEDGFRQYRFCYIEIPKKNGKSELGAGVTLYMLTADGEASPEVYGAAADRNQAGLIYNIASIMVMNDEVLSKNLEITRSLKRMMYYRNNGFYQVLSSDVKTKHGLNPSAVIFDELHSQPNDQLWRVLTSGTAYARQQQVVFVMTTAGIFDKNSIWWKIREKARQVKAGIIKDPEFLAVLYVADPEEDDPEDEELWKRVNPSLGHIFTLDKVRADYDQAKNNPVDWADFCRYRLNIPAKHIKRWMPMRKWDACEGTKEDFIPENLLGRTCAGGVDLSSTQDLTGFLLVFPPLEEEGSWIILTHAYCPEDTITERSRQDNVKYDIWAKQGLITPTPGDYIDYAYVKRDIVKAADLYDLQEVGYDPWNASQLAGELFNEEGIKMIEMRQGTKTLSEPAKDILTKTLAGKISHNGHAILRWCADNVVMVPDANENIRPAKDKAVERIDLFVALIMAWGRAIYLNQYYGGGVTVLE